MKLRYQWTPVLLLIFLIPLRGILALPPDGGTWVQHLLYPLAHANFLHWFCNCAAWFALWSFVTPRRLAASYLSAILIGFAPWSVFREACLAAIPSVPSSHLLGWLPFSEACLAAPSASPTLGFSVIIFWFLGFILPALSTYRRMRLLLLVLISLFIPGMAASFHIAAMLMGLSYNFLRRLRPKE